MLHLPLTEVAGAHLPIVAVSDAHSPEHQLINAALAWHAAGFQVWPTASDGTKRPAGQWKDAQRARLSAEELTALLDGGRHDGIGVMLGQVSGNAEMIELEPPTAAAVQRIEALKVKAAADYAAVGGPELLQRVLTGCVEQSAGGGLHVFIRVSDGPALGNTKLAHADGKVIAETRGEGGFCVVAPTPGRNGHAAGSAYSFLKDSAPHKVAEITAEERDLLHLLIADALDQGAPVAAAAKEPTPVTPHSDATSPLDDYRERTTWAEILKPAGWTFSHSDHDGRSHWVRPGKRVSEGTSATTIEDGPLYNFSSNAPLPVEVGLSKGQVYAHLHHGGDLTAATRALREAGYGSQVGLAEFILDDGSDHEAAVFGATPELTYVLALAREQMVSPWALLGTMTSLAIAAVSPEVRIPAFIGTRASLNFGVALASASGGGKSAAMSVAWEQLGHAMQAYDVAQRNPASGEGIVTMFVDTDSKGEQTMIRSRCVAMIDEIGTLAAQGNRSGSTLMSVLRTALTGGSLGSHSAEKSRRRHLDAGTYRLCLAVAVQPLTAQHFLADGDAGTPQRFLWMPASDPGADPSAPSAGPSIFDGWQLPQHGPDITYPAGVREQVRQAQAQRLRGEGHALDGHAMLTRLKLAAGLALLHRSTTVSPELWEVSGQVMAVSDRTREHLMRHAQRQQRAAAMQRGHSAAIAEEAKTDAQVERCALVIARKVHASREPLTRRQVKDAAGRHREVWRDALALAVERGYVTATPVPGQGRSGFHYLPGEVKP